MLLNRCELRIKKEYATIIQSKRGVPISDLHEFQYDKEVLFPLSAQFKVTAIKEASHLTRIYMDEV